LNVPKVSGPRELGIGLKLIEGFASADLRGGCRFSFDPPGLRCVIHANLDSHDLPAPMAAPATAAAGRRAQVQSQPPQPQSQAQPQPPTQPQVPTQPAQKV